MKDQNTPTNILEENRIGMLRCNLCGHEFPGTVNHQCKRYSQAEVDQMVSQAVNKAETNAVAWTIGVIDELHIHRNYDLVPESDKMFKGIKNTVRDRYKFITEVDPAPNYPIVAELNRGETPNQVEGEKDA